jgi:hypothetical protein
MGLNEGGSGYGYDAFSLITFIWLVILRGYIAVAI